MIDFTGSHFESGMWRIRFLPATRRDDGRAGRRVDHATLNRWVIKYSPEFEKQFRRRHQPVRTSWRMDETYVRQRAVDTYIARWIRGPHGRLLVDADS